LYRSPTSLCNRIKNWSFTISADIQADK
jgi:hypothetical protein